MDAGKAAAARERLGHLDQRVARRIEQDDLHALAHAGQHLLQVAQAGIDEDDLAGHGFGRHVATPWRAAAPARGSAKPRWSKPNAVRS
jgi:hypothetical protein